MTHFLTGACLGRAGFNRKTAYATLAMTLAAEAPDLDVLWGIGGPMAAFQHHRGWTHSFIGTPVVATAVVGAVWLWHRWRASRPPKVVVAQPGHQARPPEPPMQPRWGLLWLFSLVAALSHILLDYTNNYGVRPFFPFNPRWYSLDIVFIFEPMIFAALLIGLVAPSVFGLAASEVGARRPRFRGRGWAIFALIAVGLIWTWRAAEHQHALNLVRAQDYMQSGQEQPLIRAAAEPYPGNPFHWHTVAETPNYFQLAEVNTRTDSVVDDAQGPLYKPPATAATIAADRSWLGRAYLDWAKYPYVQDLGAAAPGAATEGQDAGTIGAGDSIVRFTELRFAYPTFLTGGADRAPLSGEVVVNANGKTIEMTMGARTQR